MATITRSTTWSDGQVLTAAALNGEFNNALNALALVNADISGSAAIAVTKISGTAATLAGPNTYTGSNIQTINTYSPAGGGTATLDLTKGPLHFVTVPAGNITIALSGGSTGQAFIVRFTNDASVRTITWFTTIKWTGGAAPALSGSSKIDTFGFIITGTNTYDGYIVGTAGA